MVSEEELNELLEIGLLQIKSGNPVNAILTFEELLVKSERSAISLSYLGLAMARAKQHLKIAEKLCKEAIYKSPRKGDFYVSLAEVYLSKGDKTAAMETLRQGLKADRMNKKIRQEISLLDVRQRPVIPFLPRSNFLNKSIGKFRSRSS